MSPLLPLVVLPVAARVVGGEVVGEGENPEVAAVYFGDSVGCTGVLITPEWVLTAGHCSAATGVRLGVVDYAEGGGEWRELLQVVEHPDSEETLDLALLQLSEPSSITPAALASGCVVEEALIDGASVLLTGYGATDKYGNSLTTELHQATAEVIDADCTSLSRGCREGVSPGGELIAGGEGVDTCIGDSGGPVYLPTPWGSFVGGITSRAVTDTTAFCEGGGIYVRPDAALDWIESVTGVAPTEPVCEIEDSGEGPEPSCGCGGDAALLLLLGWPRRRR